VPPRVRYGMVCLLIRDEWEFGVVTRPGSHGASGAVVPRLPLETLALAVVPRLPWETLALLWYCDYLS
jgi:hypothetical protein